MAALNYSKIETISKVSVEITRKINLGNRDTHRCQAFNLDIIHPDTTRKPPDDPEQETPRGEMTHSPHRTIKHEARYAPTPPPQPPKTHPPLAETLEKGVSTRTTPMPHTIPNNKSVKPTMKVKRFRYWAWKLSRLNNLNPSYMNELFHEKLVFRYANLRANFTQTTNCGAKNLKSAELKV